MFNVGTVKCIPKTQLRQKILQIDAHYKIPILRKDKTTSK